MEDFDHEMPDEKVRMPDGSIFVATHDNCVYDMYTYKHLYLGEKDLTKEKEVLQLLNDPSKTMHQKAVALGFRKTTANVDGVRKTAYTNDWNLYLRASDVIDARRSSPLGFDCYYWGWQCYILQNKVKEDEESYNNIF